MCENNNWKISKRSNEDQSSFKSNVQFFKTLAKNILHKIRLLVIVKSEPFYVEKYN